MPKSLMMWLSTLFLPSIDSSFAIQNSNYKPLISFGSL